MMYLNYIPYCFLGFIFFCVYWYRDTLLLFLFKKVVSKFIQTQIFHPVPNSSRTCKSKIKSLRSTLIINYEDNANEDDTENGKTKLA